MTTGEAPDAYGHDPRATGFLSAAAATVQPPFPREPQPESALHPELSGRELSEDTLFHFILQPWRRSTELPLQPAHPG